MSRSDDPFVERVRDALDASEDTLPPGVASRLAGARADALAQRSSGWRWLPVGYGALATAAVLLVAVTMNREDSADAPAPEVAGAPEALPADLEDLDLAMDLDVVEELEFVAWLALEDTGAGGDAG